jgi:alpha-glucosidase
VLPYLYTLADDASRHGQPMVRPLCWPTASDGPDAGSSADRALWTVDDAYRLGDALLVAPVTVDGARSRAVPLPAGRWYRWRALPTMADDWPAADVSAVVDGGRTVDVDAPAGQPAVFVRGGSIVPLDDGWLPDGPADDGPADGALAAGHEPRRLAVHCFPDADGVAAGVVYDDAGDGFGPYRRDQFRLAMVDGNRGDAPAETVLTWARDGTYPAPDRLRVVVHGIAAVRAFVDGREVAGRVGRPDRGLPVTTVDDLSPFAVLRIVR